MLFCCCQKVDYIFLFSLQAITFQFLGSNFDRENGCERRSLVGHGGHINMVHSLALLPLT